MSQSHRHREIVHAGRVLRIECAMCLNGTSPSSDFLRGLRQPELSKVQALLERMADHGEICNREKFKKVKGQIWEFKSFQIRLLCFQDGKNWVLTHGFVKKQDQIPKREIERAEQIRAEDQSQKGLSG